MPITWNNEQPVSSGIKWNNTQSVPELNIVESGIDLESTGRTKLDYLSDLGVTAAKGVIGAGETAVGLADLVSGGYAGKGLAYLGYDPKETHKIFGHLYSDPQKEAFRKVSEAKGFLDTLATSVENPSTIVHTVLESLPSMIGGGAIGKGLLKAGTVAAPYIAGAIGEGAVQAGAMAEQTRQETETGTLTPGQVASSIGSGLVTGAIGAIGGKIAQKLGIGDIDTLLAKGDFAEKSSKGVVRRILEGGITEGFFEELPQSMQEQIWSNAALGKPLNEGVSEAGATGLLAGVAMGGGANIFTQAVEKQQTQKDDKLINQRVENITSHGPEVINASIIQIGQDVDAIKTWLNDPQAVLKRTKDYGTTVEEVTVNLNKKLELSTKLQKRLMKEIGLDTEPVKPVEETPVKETQSVKEPKTEEDLYWKQQEKVIRNQIANREKLQRRLKEKYTEIVNNPDIEENVKSSERQRLEQNQREIDSLWKKYEEAQADLDARKAHKYQPDSIDLAGQDRQRQIDRIWLPAEQELDERHNQRLNELKALATTPEEKAQINDLILNFQRRTPERIKTTGEETAESILLTGQEPTILGQQEPTFLDRATERLGGKVEPDVIFDKEKYRQEILAEERAKTEAETSSFKNEQQLELGRLGSLSWNALKSRAQLIGIPIKGNRNDLEAAIRAKTGEPQFEVRESAAPLLSNTEEAITFGKTATPEQIEQLKNKWLETQVETRKLQLENKRQEAYNKAFEGQLYREALEAAGFEVNQNAKTIDDVVVTPEIDEYSPEQIAALKGTMINMPISIEDKTENDSIDIDAHDAYMENADQISSIESLMDCITGMK